MNQIYDIKSWLFLKKFGLLSIAKFVQVGLGWKKCSASNVTWKFKRNESFRKFIRPVERWNSKQTQHSETKTRSLVLFVYELIPKNWAIMPSYDHWFAQHVNVTNVAAFCQILRKYAYWINWIEIRHFNSV